MQAETISEALCESAQSVLETMFFVMTEGDAEPACLPESSVLRAGLSFRGEWNGMLQLTAPLSSAKRLASNFSGAADTEEVTDEDAAQVMRELANMVCGSTLSRLAGDKIFDLESPTILYAPISTSSESSTTTTRTLDLGFGVLAFTLEIEDAQ